MVELVRRFGRRVRRLPSDAAAFVRRLASEGPQRVVLVIAGLVVLLIGLLGWFLVAGDEDEDVETAGSDEPPEVEPTTTTVATTTSTTTAPTTTVPATTTTLSEEEQAELEVVEAFEEAMAAFDEASAPPEPDPEHPGMEEHYTGAQYDETVLFLELMVSNGTAMRYPEGSIFREEVTSVTLGEGEATLEVCRLTDEEEFWIATGEAVPSMAGVRTFETTYVMRLEESVWKVAEAPAGTQEEGIVGCAQDFD